MVLIRTCLIIVLVFQHQRALNGEYLTKERKTEHGGYYNPWTPTYLTVGRFSSNNQGPQSQPYIGYIDTKRPISIYYPPQVIYFNSGHPVHNPHNLVKEDTTTVSVLNRFGDEDDGPVWDTVTASSNRIIPTRRNLMKAQAITFPPIIRHESTTARNAEMTNSLFRIKSEEIKSAPSHNSNPSRCVWAIISCCSMTSAISYECFEQLGCEGAFWGPSPCESDFAQAAVVNIMNYYQSK